MLIYIFEKVSKKYIKIVIHFDLLLNISVVSALNNHEVKN